MRYMIRTLLFSFLFPVVAFAHGGVEDGHPDQPIPASPELFAIARVIAIEGEHPDTFVGITRTVQTLRLRIISGADTGVEWTVENGILGDRADMRYKVGDKVVVESLTKVDGNVSFLLREKYRLPSLGWLVVAFLILAVA